jgi:hypothetical protein
MQHPRIVVSPFVAMSVMAAVSPALGAGIEYSAPSGCPSRDDFVAAIARRGVDVEAATAGLAVNIAHNEQGFVGQLRVEAGEGGSAPRRVLDEDCARVADGLAVVAAIVLGKGEPAETLSIESAPEQTAPVDSAPALPVTSEAKAAEPDDELALRSSALARVDSIDVEEGELKVQPSRTWTLTAGADFGTIGGLVLPRYDLTASLATFLVTPEKATHLVGPLLQVRWSFVGPGTHHSTRGYDTEVLGIHGGLASCFPFNYDTHGLTLLACGEFMIEYANLTTDTPSGVLEQDAGSGSAGIAMDGRYAIGAGFHLGLRAGGRLRFGKLSARDENGNVLFESGMAGGFVSAGLGVGF